MFKKLILSINKTPERAQTALVLLFVLPVSITLFFIFGKSGSSNTEIVTYNSQISGRVCSSRVEHGFHDYLFCDDQGGCYFAQENPVKEMDAFLDFDETVIKKQKNDTIVRFINFDDTLTIAFHVDKKNRGVLYDGEVVP